MRQAATRLFDRLPAAEESYLARALRQETVGGALLLAAALVAIVWANSPWSEAYDTVRTTVVGPSALNLDLDLQHWAGDGLLAIFFFVAGLELKRELVVGQLRRPADALLPVAAAFCGMVVPALVYVAVTRLTDRSGGGWAVPTATDIAFALAVLAVVGRNLPSSVRAFLLTLAVVDDLGAILIIAVFFTDELVLWAVAAAIAGLAVYALLQRRRVQTRWLYVPLALAVWALVHESGVHATIAGVALGLLTRVRPDPDEESSPAERLEHRVRPLSAGLAVPAFALMSAGVAVSASALSDAAGDIAALGVVCGLVVGKLVGVLGGTWLTARFTRAELAPGVGWSDMAAVALLSGIGFTVSLLISELAFAEQPARLEHVKVAVLAASLLAATLASVLLRRRSRTHADANVPR
jgi:NhaA family Na+:H+ antiporter